MNAIVNIEAYGEKGVLISWPSIIDEQISVELLSVKEYLREELKNDLIDISNGYQSVLLYFKGIVTQRIIEDIHLKIANKRFSKKEHPSKIWKVPVCYSLEYGLDLEAFLNQQAITLEALIEVHTKSTYHVYCKGFLPGFLYLGGLDKQLHLPRKTTPNLRIPKNSVAIGGEQTGIYPSQSPGGWHIIGRTPITLFDIEKDSFGGIQVGDKVKFNAISKATFLELERQNTLEYIE